MPDHSHSQVHTKPRDYLLLAGIMLAIFLASVFLAYKADLDSAGFMRVFTGAFLLTFGAFKLMDWEGFAESFAGYDLIAQKYKNYAYAYPVLEMFLGLTFFFNFYFINFIVLAVTSINGISIILRFMDVKKATSANFGHYLNIPLVTVSFIEDIIIATAALFLIVLNV